MASPLNPPPRFRFNRNTSSYASLGLPLALAASLSSRALVAIADALPFGNIFSNDNGRANVLAREKRSLLSLLGHGGGGETYPPGSPEFYAMLGLTTVLVCVGGMFAGLTIAYMSLDLTNLQILIAAGDPQDKKYAEKILPVRERGHLLLITLLLGTVVVNESIPILMDSVIGGGVYAVVISTLLVVIFGEIIPNAICNIYGLAIGAFCAPLIKVCMFLMWPVAWPIAKLLDCLLGEKEGVVYRRAELKTLIAMHQESKGVGNLSDDEVNIIAGVLDLSSKTVLEVMTPVADVFTIGIDDVLDAEMVDRIRMAGYSRIPVYEGDKKNLIAMFLVKSLVGYYVEDEARVRDFPLSFLPIVGAQTELFDLLNFFQEGRSHMAAVLSSLPSKLDKDTDGLLDETRVFRQEDSMGKDLGYAAADVSQAVKDFEEGQPRSVVGIVTLEDVIEELLGEEIVDETDVYVDNQSKQRAIRKPWKELMTSVQGFVQSSRVPIRNRPSFVKTRDTATSFQGTEREPLLASQAGQSSFQPNKTIKKEAKKQKLIDQAIKEGVFPGGVAGQAIAGTLKKKELKKLIRRKTEPAMSPRVETFDQEAIVDEPVGKDGGGGQEL